MDREYDTDIITLPYPDVRTEEQYRRVIIEYLLLFFFEKGAQTIMWPILQTVWPHFLELLNTQGITPPNYGYCDETDRFENLDDIFFFLSRAGFGDYNPDKPQRLNLLLHANVRMSLRENANEIEYNAVMSVAPVIFEQYQIIRSSMH